jgi:cysteine desulfurase/selenocysteine lyase
MEKETFERFRREFPITGQWTYLNHAAVSPLPRLAAERMAAMAASVAQGGDRGWPQRQEEVERVRGLAARLIGAARPHEVAFVENTSTGLSLVAAGLDWRPGDNLVGAAPEFPSNVYPWMQLAARGVDYRRVPERQGRIDLDPLLAAIDGRTRVVALSWVQYASGFRADLARIGAACRARGVLFVVDAVQGLGGLALDVERDGVDVAAAAAHKWLLGPEGIALLYVADRVVERLAPARSGWRSMRRMFDWEARAIDWNEGARRFESGTLNAYGIAGLGGTLDLLLAAGTAAVEERVLALAGRAAEGLAARGWEIFSSRRPGETSGIVSASHPRHAGGDQVARLVDRLAERGVVVSARAGRLRVAPHFYNAEEEIDRMVSTVAGLAGLAES